ncbi:hypothetical protein [Rasiella sp. SM2506]
MTSHINIALILLLKLPPGTAIFLNITIFASSFFKANARRRTLKTPP